MTGTELRHKLAAILAADAAGYSRLMSIDDRATVAALDAARAVFRTQIETQQGRIVDMAGDSVLGVFGTATGAVNAALAIQAQVNALADAETEDRRMRFRIGVHLGDVVEKADGTVYGDGVNIAARLEGLAAPGGVTVSDSIRSAVSGKADAAFDDQGEQQVKNIVDPVRVWGLRAPGLRSALPRAAQPTPTSAPATNLPARPTRLIGRADEVAQAHRLLGTHRLVTVTAVGGSGKTRLAIAIGEEEMARRPHGVWFVDLNAVMSNEEVPGAIAAALGLVLGGGDAKRQITAYLADKSVLLILDNCEHVIEACAAFAEAFLAVAGRSVMLATSREALDVDGEQIMPLGSLSALASADGEPAAVLLFVERATAIAPDFRLGADNRAAVLSLCEHLDGMPLAIELAAARITVMTPAELLSGLGDRFALLSGGRRRQRQRTLEATLDWSYNLLDAEQQRAFRAVGVFVGGFDAEATAAVTGLARTAALHLLEALVAKSLVQRTPGQAAARFGLLETLKAYAEDRLVQADEAALVRERHLQHFHHLAMALGRVIDADVRFNERLRHDRSNIVSAVDWAATHERWVEAGELLLGALGVFEIYGYAAEAKALFQRCEAPVAAVEAELAGLLRCAIGPSLVLLDDWETYGQVIQKLAASDDPRQQVVACGTRAFVHAFTNPGEARKWLEQGYAALARIDTTALSAYDYVRSGSHRVAGCLHLFEGDPAAALAEFDQATSLSQHLGRITPRTLQVQIEAAMCLLLLGEPTQALARAARTEGLSFGYGDHHAVEALAHLALGNLDIAMRRIRDHALEGASGKVNRQCNDSVLLLAQLAHTEGDDQTAVDLLSKVGVCRTPSTILFSRVLARELGVAEQRIRDEQECRTPQGAALHGPRGVRRATVALRAELERRGWA